MGRAACLLKLDDPLGAAMACDHVLRDDPRQLKALYRRALAQLRLGNFDAAQKDVRCMLEQDKNNVDARRLLVQVKDAKRDYAQQAKLSAARMLNADTPVGPVHDYQQVL